MTVDGSNFSIVLSERNAAMLEKLGSMRIIPKHIWESVEKPEELLDETNGIGCGPYTITGYNKEQGAYEFTAFPRLLGTENQAVDVICFVPVSDALFGL